MTKIFLVVYLANSMVVIPEPFTSMDSCLTAKKEWLSSIKTVNKTAVCIEVK